MSLRNYYREYLNQLLLQVMNMGEEVEKVLKQTISVLYNIDTNGARKIFLSDYKIDKIEHDVETKCINILTLQHPAASDFRLVTGYLKLITDLERIADQCADICEIISMERIYKNNSCLNLVIKMFETVFNKMFLRVLNIIKETDASEAGDICVFDDKIDSMFSDIVFNICCIISTNGFEKNSNSNSNSSEKDLKQISPKIAAAIDLLFITKYIERIGDHCTNVAEWIIYIKTGVHSDLN